MIFAILNQKGGVAKTTTAVTFAHAAALVGLKTLLVDTDSQANCSDALGVEPGPDLYKLLVEGVPLEHLANQVRENLFLLRSDKSTLQAENIIMGMDFREYLLANALEAHDYDLVFLDCAPSAHVLHTGAMVAADYLVIPTELAQFGVKGIYEVTRSLKSITRVTTSNCQIAGILPTKLNRSKDESHAQLANLVQAYGALVWPPIPTDAKVEIANRKGQTLFEFSPRPTALIGYRDGKARRGGYMQAFKRLLELVK